MTMGILSTICYMPTRAELIMNEIPFYNRYLNNRKKKYGRN